MWYIRLYQTTHNHILRTYQAEHHNGIQKSALGSFIIIIIITFHNKRQFVQEYLAYFCGWVNQMHKCFFFRGK